MSEQTPTIGIDLGTSNSCVARMQNGRVTVLENEFGEKLTPSTVSYEAKGLVRVGTTAKVNAPRNPEFTVASAKRLIGRYFFAEEVAQTRSRVSYGIIEGPQHSVRITTPGGEVSVPEVSAAVLGEMKRIASRCAGKEISSAVITVPAYFNDNQRQATKDAGQIAGLDILRIVNEPTAAALAYGFGRGLQQRVAVYDLGGGTFDVSILRIENDVFEVLATCGDTFLGGDDFDDRILDRLADEYRQATGVDLRSNPHALESLRAAAETAKNTLSFEETARLQIARLPGTEEATVHSIDRELSRGEFASLVQDLVQRTFKVCDEALQAAELTVRDLDGVILVGGPTRLPMIRSAVSDYFQQAPKVEIDPDQVVALGAAIHAASLESSGPPIHLLDVTPLDLRIGVAGGLAEPIIERNTPVPIQQARRFTTLRDYQDSVEIRVYQGTAREATQNELLGHFVFSDYRKGRREEVSIDVSFALDHEGIVEVTATDPHTGAQVSKQITLSSRLADSECGPLLDTGTATMLPAPKEAPRPRRNGPRDD